MRFKPWYIGVKDGIVQPWDFTMGMTWPDDDDANEAYDRGVNFGQMVGRLVALAARPVKTARRYLP